MEFKTSEPRKPIHERTTPELIDDLCIALRHIGVWSYSIKSAKGKSFIKEARALFQELEKRRQPLAVRLESLSAETGWQMNDLLAQVLMYPSVTPYVRELDGVRKRFRCIHCRKKEVPESPDVKLWYCQDCLAQSLRAIRAGGTASGFKTQKIDDVELWCEHANADALLLWEDQRFWNDVSGLCERCIEEELQRRKESDHAQS